MMREAVFFVLLFALIALTGTSRAADSCPPTLKGYYSNSDYGYSVTIPAGLQGEWSSPCKLDPKEGCICIGSHGLTVRLETDAYLDFFAAFSALEHPSLPDILRSQLSNLGKGSDDVTVRMDLLKEILLEGRPAYHLVASYEMKGKDYTEERIISVDTHAGVYYLVSLKTPENRFAALRPRFRDLVASWRWIPVQRANIDQSRKDNSKAKDLGGVVD